MNFKLLALVGLLLLVAAGSWWLLRQTSMQVGQGARAKNHAPDYYFTDATVTSLGLDGKPVSELKAPRIIHHPDDDSVEVFKPRMRYFTKQGLPWYAQADHGLEPSGGNLIYLSGHVELSHPDANGAPTLTIDTEHMKIDLDTNVASTDDSAVMVKGESRMTGTGMDAYMQENRLVLRSAVVGIYVTKQP